MREIFLDTSFAIALSASTDQNHAKAVELAEQIESQNICLVTTQAILLEIGNALSKHKYRTAAIQLLESLESDPNVKIVPLTNYMTQHFNYSEAVKIKNGDWLIVFHL